MHVVGAGDLSQGLANLSAGQRLPLLVGCQLRLAPEPHAPILGTLPTFPCPSADQLTLELGQATSTVSIRRPCGVVVSAQVSFSERKPACLSATAARVLSRSRVERASRSRRVTRTTSPGLRARRRRVSSGRSARAPLTFSRKTFSAPAPLS